MRPFVNIPSAHGNVVFNWRGDPIGDLTPFAMGYKDAADRLATEFAKSPGYADYEGYPILFLYRHSLELYLKAIVYRGARLMGLIGKEEPTIPKLFECHKLSRLIPPVRAVFRAMHWDFNFEGSQFASFDEFEEFIHTIDSIDAGSYAFRYPMNRVGQANLPHHLTINIVSFAQTMSWLLDLLDGAALGIGEMWDAAAESAYELQQYLADAGAS